MKTLPSSLELCAAYANGYFPMPDPDSGEIGWYRPDPRAILPLDGFHCSRSLQKTLRSRKFTLSFDKAFAEVMEGCAERAETWINDEFRRAYQELYSRGYAHSVEVWEKSELVGGVYGVSLNAAFFAESMFHRATDASKVALFHLVEHLRRQNFLLLEVQFLTPHLASLGAIEIPGVDYDARLQRAISKPTNF